MTAPIPPTPPGGDEASEKSQKQLPEPRLEVYFGLGEISAGSFVRAVKEARIHRFADSDIKTATELSRDTDGDNSRLLALAHQQGVPDAIERWIGTAIQSRIQDQIEGFDPTLTDSDELLRVVCRSVASSLDSKDKDRKKRHENLLRLTLYWLSRYRSLRSPDTFRTLSQLLFDRREAALQSIDRTLQLARIGDLEVCAAISAVFDEMIKSASNARDRLFREALTLKDEIERLGRELDGSKACVSDLTKLLTDTEEKLDAALTEYQQMRRLWEYERMDSAGKTNSLYQETLIPLLSDAIDVLEIGPEHGPIAIERIRSALLILKDASK